MFWLGPSSHWDYLLISSNRSRWSCKVRLITSTSPDLSVSTINILRKFIHFVMPHFLPLELSLTWFRLTKLYLSFLSCKSYRTRKGQPSLFKSWNLWVSWVSSSSQSKVFVRDWVHHISFRMFLSGFVSKVRTTLKTPWLEAPLMRNLLRAGFILGFPA